MLWRPSCPHEIARRPPHQRSDREPAAAAHLSRRACQPGHHRLAPARRDGGAAASRGLRRCRSHKFERDRRESPRAGEHLCRRGAARRGQGLLPRVGGDAPRAPDVARPDPHPHQPGRRASRRQGRRHRAMSSSCQTTRSRAFTGSRRRAFCVRSTTVSTRCTRATGSSSQMRRCDAGSTSRCSGRPSCGASGVETSAGHARSSVSLTGARSRRVSP